MVRIEEVYIPDPEPSRWCDGRLPRLTEPPWSFWRAPTPTCLPARMKIRPAETISCRVAGSYVVMRQEGMERHSRR